MHDIYRIHEFKEMDLGLARMEALLEKMGHPERAFKTIHVAGTNGKGSVCTKIAKSYEHAGYKTGLYTSPHLFSIHERIQINGRPIPEMPSCSVEATYFEKLTLLAFQYFAEEKVDIAIIEVGLGGRLDATNVIHPILSIITSISFDHTAILGNTLEAIAFEKGGIIKPNTPLVLGPKANLPILHKLAKEKEALVIQIPDALFPTYDDENQAIAKAALDHLQIKPTGLHYRPPYRLQEIYPEIYFDVGHNPNGIACTLASLPRKKIHLLMGMSQDKDFVGSLQILSRHVYTAHFIRTPYERLLNPAILQAHYPGSSQAYNFIPDAIKNILSIKKPGELVLILGSFYIMQEIKEAFDFFFKNYLDTANNVCDAIPQS